MKTTTKSKNRLLIVLTKIQLCLFDPKSDLAEFQFPAAPPSRAQSEKVATPGLRERKLSEAVCMLSDSERRDRLEKLEKADDFITLSDGRCFRVGIMMEGKR